MKSGFRFVVFILGLAALSVFNNNLGNCAALDAKVIVDNISEGEKQSVLSGKIDSLTIKRGPVEILLGPGDVTLYDFGSGRIAAMTFKGKGSFRYSPPDNIEVYQLHKFTKQDSLIDTFQRITLFFTVELDRFPDTSKFSRGVIEKTSWDQISEAQKDAFDHLGMYMPNSVTGDLLAGGPGSFFFAELELAKTGTLVFCEDPLSDDVYTLYKLIHNIHTKADVIGGFSPENDLVSQRGVLPVDINHYNIESKISSSGKMAVKCTIFYTPLRWGRQFVYFKWYSDNKINSALDARGDSLFIVHKKDESGFGLVLNRTMEVGVPDTITIDYQPKSLDNVWGVYYFTGSQTYWYPWNIITDPATYELTYDCPDDYQVISVGDSVDCLVENGRRLSKWSTPKQVGFASFNIGIFDTKTIALPELPAVNVFLSKAIPHDEIALYLASQGELSSSDMLGRVGADVTNSMAFYNSLFGPCPFTNIKVTEIPASHGQGPPGIIHLSWATFQQERIGGIDEQFRAHEVAHQWWGHVVDNESYRDTWIIEGLAEYCGYWFYQMSAKNPGVCRGILKYWKDFITSGGADAVGTKAGPVTLGYRLDSSKSSDYNILVYEKGAYIFHMIRYIMHDYKTNSDDAFAAFLKELATKYRGRTITTARLQKQLEEFVGEDVSWFFNQWVYGTEIPTYTFSYTSSKTEDEKYKVTCHIKQENVSPGFQMMVPVTVIFDEDRYANLKIWIDQPEMDIELPILPSKPQKIIFNSYDAVLCDVRTK